MIQLWSTAGMVCLHPLYSGDWRTGGGGDAGGDCDWALTDTADTANALAAVDGT